MNTGSDDSPSSDAPPPAGMAARVRAFDWARTPLGPIDSWPAALRTAVDICLASPAAMFVWWGPELINVYNDAYAPVLGRRHPDALGRPAREIWADIWPDIAADVDRVVKRGESVAKQRVRFVMERNGYPEETFFSYAHSPIPDGRGGVGGLFQVCTDETERVRAEAASRAAEGRFRALATASGAVLYKLSADWSELQPLDGKGLVPSNDAPIRGWFERNVAAVDHAAVRERIAHAIATKTPFDMEHRTNRPDGTMGWPPGGAPPGRGPGGAILGGGGAAEDATARRAADDRLRASEERFRRAMGISTVGVFFFSLDGRIHDANEAFERMSGYRADELRRVEDWAVLTVPEFLGVTRRAADELAARGETAPYEKQMVRRDGTRWWGLFAPTRLSGGGRGSQCVEFVVDVTDRKRAEAYAHAILESVTDGFFSLDRDWNFTYLNAAAERFLLRPRGELVGRGIWAEFPGAVGTNFEREYRRAMADRVPVRFVEHYPAPLDAWYEARAYPSSTGLSVYFQDITERRRAEEALREARERLELALDAGELGTFYCPMPLGEIVWNAKCKEHFFLPPDAKVDFDLFYAIIHPDDRAATRAAVERAVFGRTGYDVEYRTVSPDGRRQRWVRAKGRAYYDQAGEPIRFDGVTIDISDRKAAEEERAKLLDAERAARLDAERASRMKDEFLATLSHELRTPLNAILGWSQVLAGDAADVDEGLRVIERNARAQARIIDDLLDMSRIIAGKVRLDVRRVPLAPVVEAAAETVRPAADAKGVRVQVVLDPLAGPVSGDPARLQQVFWNLLSNSVKHTARGGRVRVLLERVNSHVEVSVTDDGEGISPDFLPHVFDRFRQADGSTTRRHGGLGLGLSIVKHLVELHGGTVRAKSRGVGQGATFVVTLPLSPVRAEPEGGGGVDDGRRRPQAGGGDEVTNVGDGVSLVGVRVLVVDDEPDARELVRRILADRGADVTAAASAAEAVDAVRGGRPDLILSDIGMPDEDGYALIRRVRALPPASGGDVPAVALTAYARSEDRTRAMLAGFNGHLAKPVEPAELIATVAALARRRLRTEEPPK